MSTVKSNVVGLHKGSVYEDIRTFIDKFQSVNTRSNYERHLRNFFIWFAGGKSLEVLEREDLQIRNADMIRYQLFLRNHAADYTNTTINTIIAAIQSLYEFLERNEYGVNSKYAKVDVLPDDSNGAGDLYHHEAEKMADIVRNQRKGQEKSALIRLAYTTSLRKSSLLALEWSNITKNPNDSYYLVNTIGKGGTKHTVPISPDLYNELLMIKEQKYYQQYEDDKIFHLSTRTIQDMMNTLKEEMEIPKERNIVFHSFRNVAASYGSLEEVQDHLNHSNINTTKKFYRHKLKDRSQSISLRMEDKIDEDVFKDLSKEELIEIILSQNVGALVQMKKDANKILERRGDV